MNSAEDILMWHLFFCNPDINWQAGAFKESYNCFYLEAWWGSTFLLGIVNHLRSHVQGLNSLNFYYLKMNEWLMIYMYFELPERYLMYCVSHQKLNIFYLKSFFSVWTFTFLLQYFFLCFQKLSQDPAKLDSAGFQFVRLKSVLLVYHAR